MAAEDEARRIRQIVVAQSPGISAGKRGNAKKSAEYDRRVTEFFARARADETFTTRDVCRGINYPDSAMDVVLRSIRRVAPADWHMISTHGRGRFLFVHSSNRR